MNVLILISALFVLSGCVSHAVSVSNDNKNVQPAPTIENVNANVNGRTAYSVYKYDQTLLDKLDAENERFRQTPDEFKSVDFKNFKYDFGRLEDGEFEKAESGRYASGGHSASFEDVFYVDLIGDAKKEAIVLITYLVCGGSCDGGADIVYFYSSQNENPRLIDVFNSGANAGGCSLKSFTVKNKQISIEQFGTCWKDTSIDTNRPFIFKYLVKDETRSVYSINKNGLKRQSVDVVETEVFNVMDSPAFISINE